MLYLKLAWAFLRANHRWMLPLAAIAAVLAILTYAHHEHDVARHATQRAEVAQQQSANDQRAVQAVEHIIHTETVIREKADHTVATIQSSPGASDELPKAVRDSLCAGLVELRQRPVCVGDNPNDTAGTVPGPNG
jgi:hypothetical protein